MTLSVLVTRPRDQAASLVDAIAAIGAKSFTLPSIEIQPYLNMPEAAAMQVIQSADYCLATSANAVKYLPQMHMSALCAKSCLAIGPATAQALRGHGVVDVQIPEEYSSEGLLSWITDQKLVGKFCLLTGRNPKPVLQQALDAIVIESYERRLPVIDWLKVWPALQSAQINWVISTSQEALHNLYTLFVEHRIWLLGMNLVVIKSAMRDWALEHAWQGEIVVAENATDAAIIEAIVRIA